MSIIMSIQTHHRLDHSQTLRCSTTTTYYKYRMKYFNQYVIYFKFRYKYTEFIYKRKV